MNKKAQQQREPFQHLNVFIILGVIIFCLPFAGMFLKISLPGWISYIGIAILIIGIIKAAMDTLDG